MLAAPFGSRHAQVPSCTTVQWSGLRTRKRDVKAHRRMHMPVGRRLQWVQKTVYAFCGWADRASHCQVLPVEGKLEWFWPKCHLPNSKLALHLWTEMRKIPCCSLGTSCREGQSVGFMWAALRPGMVKYITLELVIRATEVLVLRDCFFPCKVRNVKR